LLFFPETLPLFYGRRRGKEVKRARRKEEKIFLLIPAFAGMTIL